MSSPIYYTGVGSRKTPAEVCSLMHRLAYRLASRGYILRSGCAEGADTAFELGAFEARMHYRLATMPELYLPWEGFGGRHPGTVFLHEPSGAAIALALTVHPTPDQLTATMRKLHGRNVHQVLGPTASIPDPSRFLICWTPEASGSGGTGTAIRIAKRFGVPVFDLADSVARERIERYIG